MSLENELSIDLTASPAAAVGAGADVTVVETQDSSSPARKKVRSETGGAERGDVDAEIGAEADAAQSSSSPGIGVVGSLFVKVKGRDQPMQKQHELQLQRWHGVESDPSLPKQLLSPRQVLLSDGDQMSSDMRLSPGELRENITITGLEGSYATLASGTVIRFGGLEGACLRISIPCAPCGRIHSLVNKPDRKVTMKDLAMPRRGIFGTVLRGGPVKVGDTVQILSEEHYSSMGSSSKEHLVWLMKKCPVGKVVPIKDLILYIGEFTSWAKAVPAVIRAIQKADASIPTWRIVDSKLQLLKQDTEAQLAKLKEEGVPVAQGFLRDNTVAETAVWRPTHEELFL
mmetsp:Transcript_44758/g.106250  ORF Transcript_44758/g.106250 Transcript_44758/m.106250 type:complete len:343 (-) Transcript_44758:5-1033(-)